jgi:DNA repair exonuclease SbcCD ATPase subunit
MDKEGLRRQLYEEIHSQFESKLREARRQKSQLEEEMELSEEKWRSERRRLNAEVDRLESALADAREARRKAAPARPGKSVDSQEFARMQAAADEKLQKATQAWEAERTRLKAEISRLQSGIAELLERSNNPLRSTQHEKENLESQLRDALRAKRQAEDALLAAKSEWEQERLSLVAESVKSRRGAAAVKAAKPAQDARVEQLERQLDEAIRSRDKLEVELAKSRQIIDSLKAGQTESMARVKVELEEARAEIKLANRRSEEAHASSERERAGLERQLGEAARIREKLESELEEAKQAAGSGSSLLELEKAQQAVTSLKASQAETMARFKVELEEARAELRLANKRTEETKASAEKERKELERQLREAVKAQEKSEGSQASGAESVSSEVVAQLRRQYDERMQEMIQQKTQLAEELRRVTSLLEAERARLGANGGDGKGAVSGATIDSEKVDAEVARVQEMIAGIARLIDNPETELSTVIRKNVERAELDAYLKGILFSLGRGKGL